MTRESVDLWTTLAFRSLLLVALAALILVGLLALWHERPWKNP